METDRHFWHSTLKVTFDENVSVCEYRKEEDEEEEKGIAFLRLDRFLTEPRHFSPSRHMVSVENLLKSVCPRQPVTIVYGNLGRYPTVLSYYLDCLYRGEENVAVRVGGYDIDECNGEDDDGRDRNRGTSRRFARARSPLEEDYPDDGRDVHVLFWLEPEFGARVERLPFRVERLLIILASHLNIEVGKTLRTETVAYNLGDAWRTRASPPLSRYLTVSEAESEGKSDGGLEIFVPDVYYGRHVRVGRNGAEEVRADLGSCESASEAYLRLLNARDAVRYAREPFPTRRWSAVLRSDVRDELLAELARLKRELLDRRGKMRCNLNGTDVMVAEDVDPFLTPRPTTGDRFSV